MIDANSSFLECAGRNIHILSWGTPAREAVVIWHGVTGTCHDYKDLAARLAAEGYYVIAPDSPGCGLSDWIGDRTREASLAFYAEVARDMVRQLGLEKIFWIGSSKGGGLGIVLSGADRPAPITHLLLNDVGPGLKEKFRAALSRKLLDPQRFDNFPAFEKSLKDFLGKNGLDLDAKGWHDLSANWARRLEDGSFTFHNDPALGEQFLHHPEDFDLWPSWDKIKAKTLVLRGSPSVIMDDDAARMAMHPNCRVINRPGGHITLLDKPGEQGLILEFLKS